MLAQVPNAAVEQKQNTNKRLTTQRSTKHLRICLCLIHRAGVAVVVSGFTVHAFASTPRTATPCTPT